MIGISQSLVTNSLAFLPEILQGLDLRVGLWAFHYNQRGARMFGPGAVINTFYWQQLFTHLPDFFIRKARCLKDGEAKPDGTWVPPQYAIFPGSEAIAEVMKSQLDVTTKIKNKCGFQFMNETLFYLFLSSFCISLTMNDLMWPSKLSATLYKDHTQTPEEVMATVNVNPAHANMSGMIEDYFHNMSKLLGLAQKLLSEANLVIHPKKLTDMPGAVVRRKLKERVLSGVHADFPSLLSDNGKAKGILVTEFVLLLPFVFYRLDNEVPQQLLKEKSKGENHVCSRKKSCATFGDRIMLTDEVKKVYHKINGDLQLRSLLPRKK